MVGVGIVDGSVSEIAFCGKGVGDKAGIIFFCAEMFGKDGFLYVTNKYPDMPKDMLLKIAIITIKTLFFRKKNFSFEKKFGSEDSITKIITQINNNCQFWYNHTIDNQPIPSNIAQYFWGDNLKQLNVNKNQKYIIQTLLEIGNSDALRWVFATIDKKTIKSFLPTFRLSKKSANFWNMYPS